ncbi:MAG: hypothetical protein K2Q22_14225 [Cytophagales bacterium]|nr:hypothetical protein [Cytophagales bacterium]
MIKAGVLFLVVALALAIALLTGAYILASFHTTSHIQRNLQMERLELNAQSGINLLLSNPEINPGSRPILVDLFGEGKDSVSMNVGTWGIFGAFTVKAFAKKDTVMKSALFGYIPNDSLRAAIYMADQSRPLSLCGKTEITGKVYLPQAGAKRGYIEGIGYISNTLVKGDILRSASEIPKLSENVIGPIKSILSKLGGDSTKTISESNTRYLSLDSLVQTFEGAPIIISTNSKVILNRKYWKGQTILQSTNQVLIRANSQLSDVQIYAPSIIVEDRFKGSLQLFATDSIMIGENVKLLYPSAVGIVKNAVKKFQPFIQLSKYSDVSGVVFTALAVTDRVQARISVNENAVVTGQIYTEGFAEIKGSIIGNVTCNKFILRTSSSIYENHLLNAYINSTKLSLKYAGSWLLPSEKRKRLIKWVN